MLSKTASPVPGLGRIVQIAYVVNDVEQAASRWITQFGAGPFFLFKDIRFADWKYHGVHVETPLDIAAGQLGDLVVEFIRPLTSCPSVYRDVHPDGGEGLHHFAVLAADMEDATAHLAGAPLVTEAATPNRSRFRYYDTRPTLGVMLEVIEATEDVRGLFKIFEDASRGWDGADPLRSISL